MHKKVLSVIVPVHDSSKTIEKCLGSLIAQTYEDLEIIVVDDHSEDNSFDICRKIQRLDDRVKVYKSTERGVSAARNVGIDKSSGNYLTFVDSDDYVDISAYEKIMSAFFARTSIKMVAYGIVFEYRDGVQSVSYGVNDCEFSSSDLPMRMFTDFGVNGFACNKVYARDLICGNSIRIRFDEKISILEDNLFNYDIIFGNDIFECACIGDVYYHYLQHPASACNKKFSLRNLEYLVVRERQIKMLEGNSQNADFLKIDYLVNLKKMKIKMKILKLPMNNSFLRLEQLGERLSSENVKAVSFAQFIKLMAVKYFPFVYGVHIRIKKENI